MEAGTLVVGRVRIRVRCFPFFERLGRQVNLPALGQLSRKRGIEFVVRQLGRSGVLERNVDTFAEAADSGTRTS